MPSSLTGLLCLCVLNNPLIMPGDFQVLQREANLLGGSGDQWMTFCARSMTKSSVIGPSRASSLIMPAIAPSCAVDCGAVAPPSA